jgi:hypothetical protein
MFAVSQGKRCWRRDFPQYCRRMIGLLFFVLAVLASPFKSKLRLQAENAVLRHQLIVLRRRLPVASGLPTMIGGS